VTDPARDMKTVSASASTDDSVVRETGRDDAFATIATLSVVVAGVLGAMYWVARIGFANPPGPVLKALGLSAFIIMTPFTARSLFRLSLRRYGWNTSYSFLSIATLLAAALLGCVVSGIGLNLFYVLAALGTAGTLLAGRRFFQQRSVSASLLLLAGAAVFAQWIGGVVWGRIYKNPLFFENLSSTGVVHHDALFLSSLANMLRTYGVASTGLDGLPYIPYHWGTPWLFAQWSNLLDSSILEFYQLAYPIIVIPLFFGGVLTLSAEIVFSRSAVDGALRHVRFGGPWHWGILLAASIGVLPVNAMDAVGVWTSNLVISESYAVAVPVALLLAGAAIVFWKQGGVIRFSSRREFTLGDQVFLVGVLPLGIAALGLLKISLMLLALSLALYLAFRVRLYTTRTGAAAMTVSALLVVLAYPRVSLPAHNEGLAPLDFLEGYVPRMWWAFFPVLHLFWSWLYAFLRLAGERITTLAALRAEIAAQRLLDVEAVLFVAIIGVLPGLILHIDGGSAFYFSDVQRWFAVSALLAMPRIRVFPLGENDTRVAEVRGSETAVPAVSRMGRVDLRQVVATIFALPLLLTMMLNSIHWTKRFAQENAATRVSLYPPSRAASIPAGIHGLPYLTDRELLRSGLESSRNYKVLNGLRSLSAMSRSARRETALFIPQSEYRYWDLLTRPGSCTFSPFVAPALSGIAMVDGMPPLRCELSAFYGIGEYTPRRSAQTNMDTSVDTLCRKALAARLRRVMVLHFDASGTMSSVVTDCQPQDRDSSRVLRGDPL